MLLFLFYTCFSFMITILYISVSKYYFVTIKNKTKRLSLCFVKIVPNYKAVKLEVVHIRKALVTHII